MTSLHEAILMAGSKKKTPNGAVEGDASAVSDNDVESSVQSEALANIIAAIRADRAKTQIPGLKLMVDALAKERSLDPEKMLAQMKRKAQLSSQGKLRKGMTIYGYTDFMADVWPEIRMGLPRNLRVMGRGLWNILQSYVRAEDVTARGYLDAVALEEQTESIGSYIQNTLSSYVQRAKVSITRVFEVYAESGITERLAEVALELEDIVEQLWAKLMTREE